jgi:hypothetical protein
VFPPYFTVSWPGVAMDPRVPQNLIFMADDPFDPMAKRRTLRRQRKLF